MTARIGGFIVHEVAMLFVVGALASGLDLVETTPAQRMWLAVGVGTFAGLLVAAVAWWTSLPLLISPGWELTGRVAVWALLVALAVWVTVFVSPVVGGVAVAGVVAAGVPTLGPHLLDTVRSLPRLHWTRTRVRAGVLR